MINNVFISLRAQIRTMMNDFGDDMITGECKDWAAYQRQVGVMEGLARAERILIDTEAALKKHLDGEDAEEDA